METIRNYIDTMFKDLPKTKEVIDMKMNILDAMEDKYNELVNEGKSENEAIGTVISQFGNVDELKLELGLDEPSSDQETIYYSDMNEVERYLKFKKTLGFMIACGVSLCILGLLIVSVISSDNNNSFGNWHFMNKAQDAIGIAGFFICITIAVFIFIIFGMKNMQFSEFEKKRILLNPSNYTSVKQKYQQFMNYYYLTVAFGVILCILGVASAAVLSELMNENDSIISIGFFGPVAVGVFLFIYYGVIYNSYCFFVKNKEIYKARIDSEREDSYFAITMPLAAMLFLFIGFVFDAWHPGWLVFPITAILTTIVVQIRNKNAD